MHGGSDAGEAGAALPAAAERGEAELALARSRDDLPGAGLAGPPPSRRRLLDPVPAAPIRPGAR